MALEMIKLAIVGYGKMGKEIESHIDKNKFVVIGKYDIDNKVQDNLKDIPEVAIEFSTPQSVIQNIEFLASRKINVVCGTTGWYDKLDTVKEIIKKNNTGLVYASNFSVGMNIFFEIVRKATELFHKFEQYDSEIEEAHHIHKLDKPSGTALTIRDIITEHLKRQKEINILSHRVGDKFGDHKVIFDSEADTITLEHSAKSRSGFAEGALLAAEFINGKKGFYKFEEIFSKK
jgi:4-hydroxy-tetrahydrodipicolinate reductase